MDIPILTIHYYDFNKYEPIGLVNSLSVHAISFLRGIVGGITSIFGGRQGVIQDKFLEVRNEILKELQQNAKKMGADLIVGLDIDITELGEDIIFAASATALKLKKKNNNKRNNKK